MLRRIPDRNIWLIYVAILLLGLAYGIAISLLAVFLDARGLSKTDIGQLASVFALGIAAFSLPMGAFIRRFSAKVTLSLSLAGYALAVGVFPFLPGFLSMAAVRFLDGACSVGIWISCETILLSRAEDRHKAFVTSLYAVAMAIGYVIGPLGSWTIVALFSMPTAFVISSVIAALTSLLVLVRLDPDAPHETAHAPAGQPPPAEPQSSSAAILWRIKTSCFGTFAYGYFQASVVVFLPLFLMKEKGITLEQSLGIFLLFALGMLGFSSFAGRLGDRHGHLLLMRVLAALGTLMVLGFVFIDRYALMCVAVLIAGATLASISPVSLALQGIVTAPRDYSRSNAIYNVFYAAGMLLGPLVSSAIFAASGGPAMLYHLAALWVAFVLFTIVFAADDPAASRGALARPALGDGPPVI